MPVANKHANAERIFYPSFDGGLNLSAPAESIQNNELREAVNVEFSMVSGSLRTRGGLVWTGEFAARIKDVAEIPSSRGFLVRLVDDTLEYFTWNLIWPVKGTLSGDEPMCIAQWGERGEAVVASGGKLQRFEPHGDYGMPALTDIDESPERSRMCFVRGGRVGVVDDTDTVRFSHVGDCELWDNDPDDESTGQFIEVGYKDGMDITAVVPLSQDLIIFKAPIEDVTKGTVFRLKGDFPNWYLTESAHNTGTFSQRSVQAVGNDVFYLSPLGLAMLSSVEAYGEIKTMWPDRKVADALKSDMSDSARLWNVQAKEQLWVVTHRNPYNPSIELHERIWIFDYRRGIWTQFQFPMFTDYVSGTDNRVYMMMENCVYQLNDWYMQDDTSIEDRIEIRAKAVMGTIFRGWQTLVKAAFASFAVMPIGYARMWVNKKFQLMFKIPEYKPDYVSEDNDEVFSDDDPLVPDGNTLTARRRCILRDWNIVPSLEVVGGCCAINTAGLEIAEV